MLPSKIFWVIWIKTITERYSHLETLITSGKNRLTKTSTVLPTDYSLHLPRPPPTWSYPEQVTRTSSKPIFREQPWQKQKITSKMLKKREDKVITPNSSSQTSNLLPHWPESNRCRKSCDLRKPCWKQARLVVLRCQNLTLSRQHFKLREALKITIQTKQDQ